MRQAASLLAVSNSYLLAKHDPDAEEAPFRMTTKALLLVASPKALEVPFLRASLDISPIYLS